MKIIPWIGVVLLTVFLVISGARNYTIYSNPEDPGVINWGLQGSVNAFIGGMFTFILVLIVLLIVLWMLSRGVRKESKGPDGMVPVNE